MKTYSVELRNYTSDGRDYIEEHYDFATRSEAMQFAKKTDGLCIRFRISSSLKL